MRYCILNFSVTYKDGSEIHGKAPYRGNSLDHETLIQFIKGYFAGPKAYDDKNIIMRIEKEYADPKEWLTEIKHWETFLYLRSINNFAGDLIAQYLPNENDL